jgi:cytochrome P450
VAQGIEPVLPHVDFGIDPLPDLYAHIDVLRREGRRVAPVRYIEGIAWLLIDYDDVEAAYSNEGGLPAAPAYRRHSVPSQGVTLLAMAGEQHRINRALVSGPFQPGAIRALVEPLLEPVANRLIDGFGDARALDLVDRFTHPYPFAIISELVGIPEADRNHFMATVLLLFRYPWEPERALAARRDVTDYLTPLIHERRREPRSDLISRLATAEVEGHLLSDEEICSFIRLLYPAGAETTYLTLGSLLLEVLSDASLHRRLLEDPTLRAAAVEEALRRHSATALMPRYTEQPIEIGGAAIPADSWILFGNGPAAHDPAHFPQAEQFRLDRGPNRHLAFGKGPHFCLGSHLARAELRLAFGLLLDRLPGLRLAGEAQIAGSVLRGVRSLPVAFDAVLPAAGRA